MDLTHVYVRVKDDRVDDFVRATLENASQSLQESGNSVFEVLQQVDDPSRFVLIEGYQTADDAAAHKKSEHYKLWRESVADMMAQPRTHAKLRNLLADSS